MALLIRTGGTTEVIEPRDPAKGFTLEEVYALIGCELVQVVPTTKAGKIMIIDEEGKLKDDAEVNLLATAAYPYGDEDPIVGNAIICYDREFQ